MISAVARSFSVLFISFIIFCHSACAQKAPGSDAKPEWDFYISSVQGRLRSTMLDLGLFNSAPDSKKPFLLTISVQMQKPRPDGLSSSEESEQLNRIEDKLTEKLSNSGVVYAGRITSNSNRDFYFYLKDSSSGMAAAIEAMNAFSKYQYSCFLKPDQEWTGYLNYLYPTPEQMQGIQNRHVVEQLQTNGDDLTKPRVVQHWIYFKTENDQNAFAEKVQSDAFSIAGKTFDQSLGAFPYALIVQREDRVDLKSVDAFVIPLWKLASAHNGNYDGWETSVEK